MKVADVLFALLFIIPGLLVYFLPTIVAVRRRKKHLLIIFILNLFSGATIIGWIIELVVVFADEPESKTAASPGSMPDRSVESSGSQPPRSFQ